MWVRTYGELKVADADRPPHDHDLFESLLAFARSADPDVRSGSMFGCPAIFQGRKMAACVFGEEIGMKVPRTLAVSVLTNGRAAPFTPYGRKPMREWISVRGPADELPRVEDLLKAALVYAKQNDSRG